MTGLQQDETADRIDQIEVMNVRIPLKSPVRLGATTIAQRYYTVLKMRLADGSEGFALGYDRGMPLYEVVLTSARSYVGQRASMRGRLLSAAKGPTPAPHATMSRGASLCDVAVWDAWSCSLGKPLWALLGGRRDRVPCMPVIGYGMTAERAGRETADLTARGFRFVKVMIDGRDLEFDRAVLAAVSEALPQGASFGIDAHWSWASWADARHHCRMAEKLGAIFVEDPVVPTNVRLAGEIASQLEIPVAMGEDVTEHAALASLLEVTEIMRLDASVIGGVTGAIGAMELAGARSRTVISHVFPRLHMHFGLAYDSFTAVEAILPEVGADPIEDFYRDALSIDGGDFVATDRAGCGMALDWERLRQFSERTEVFGNA